MKRKGRTPGSGVMEKDDVLCTVNKEFAEGRVPERQVHGQGGAVMMGPRSRGSLWFLKC